MSVNRQLPHLLILPEDDANRQIAKAFELKLKTYGYANQVQVLPEVGGWGKVVEKFMEVYISKMRRSQHSIMVLLIDFDDKNLDCLGYKNRLDFIQDKVPDDLKERVFVLGSRIAPEQLKKDMNKSFEKIGKSLAKDCEENTNTTWGHHLLQHNENELKRIRFSVKSFLFI